MPIVSRLALAALLASLMLAPAHAAGLLANGDFQVEGDEAGGAPSVWRVDARRITVSHSAAHGAADPVAGEDRR
ncbi:MAG: hypothetical protein U9R79_20605 [Armatimonadota bacterium]|nr:hypothetical protein [Armatimonadota bacterium]